MGKVVVGRLAVSASVGCATTVGVVGGGSGVLVGGILVGMLVAVGVRVATLVGVCVGGVVCCGRGVADGALVCSVGGVVAQATHRNIKRIRDVVRYIVWGSPKVNDWVFGNGLMLERKERASLVMGSIIPYVFCCADVVYCTIVKA